MSSHTLDHEDDRAGGDDIVILRQEAGNAIECLARAHPQRMTRPPCVRKSRRGVIAAMNFIAL